MRTACVVSFALIAGLSTRAEATAIASNNVFWNARLASPIDGVFLQNSGDYTGSVEVLSATNSLSSGSQVFHQTATGGVSLVNSNFAMTGQTAHLVVSYSTSESQFLSLNDPATEIASFQAGISLQPYGNSEYHACSTAHPDFSVGCGLLTGEGGSWTSIIQGGDYSDVSYDLAIPLPGQAGPTVGYNAYIDQTLSAADPTGIPEPDDLILGGVWLAAFGLYAIERVFRRKSTPSETEGNSPASV